MLINPKTLVHAANGSWPPPALGSRSIAKGQAHADEMADTYHQRWEEKTSNDQLQTHLRGPGRVLRSKLADLAHQEIWAWLTVHYALAVLAILAPCDQVDVAAGEYLHGHDPRQVLRVPRR